MWGRQLSELIVKYILRSKFVVHRATCLLAFNCTVLINCTILCSHVLNRFRSHVLSDLNQLARRHERASDDTTSYDTTSNDTKRRFNPLKVLFIVLPASSFVVHGLEFEVWNLRCKIQGLGFGGEGLEFRAEALRVRVY